MSKVPCDYFVVVTITNEHNYPYVWTNVINESNYKREMRKPGRYYIILLYSSEVSFSFLIFINNFLLHYFEQKISVLISK